MLTVALYIFLHSRVYVIVGRLYPRAGISNPVSAQQTFEQARQADTGVLKILNQNKLPHFFLLLK